MSSRSATGLSQVLKLWDKFTGYDKILLWREDIIKPFAVEVTETTLSLHTVLVMPSDFVWLKYLSPNWPTNSMLYIQYNLKFSYSS
jgi:hypothetical protein